MLAFDSVHGKVRLELGLGLVRAAVTGTVAIRMVIGEFT